MKRVICPKKAKGAWIEEERGGEKRDLGLVQIVLDQTVGTMKGGAL